MNRFKLFAALLLLVLTACSVPTATIVPVEELSFPEPVLPQDPGEIGYSYNVFNCQKDLPDWTDIEGLDIIATRNPEQSYAWEEGYFTVAYSVTEVRIQINDRLVKLPSKKVVQLIPYQEDGNTYFKQVQELNPEPYLVRAVEILGNNPAFALHVNYQWKQSSDKAYYFWSSTCVLEE